MKPRLIARDNFIARYGRKAYKDLIEDFLMGVPGPVSAKRLGVSRERIRQWRDLFGTTITTYTPHDSVWSTRENIFTPGRMYRIKYTPPEGDASRPYTGDARYLWPSEAPESDWHTFRLPDGLEVDFSSEDVVW